MSNTQTSELKFSASQFKSLIACEARWGYRRILGLHEDSGDAAALGTMVHRELELWGKIGLLPTHKLSLALLPYGPLPGVGECEVAISYRTPQGPWIGKIDVACCWDDVLGFVDLGETDHVVLIDWKSSTDPEAYGLTEETLPDDPAANIYAYEAYLGGAKRVTCLWIYVKTRGAATVSQVAVEMDRTRVELNMAAYDRYAAAAQRKFRLKVDPGTLGKNLDNCYAFKKECPYIDRCKPVRVARGISVRSQDAMNDFDSQVDAVTNTAPKAPPPLPGLPGRKPPPPLPPKPAVDSNGFTITKDTQFDTGTGKPIVESGFINPPMPPEFREPAATPEDAIRIQGIVQPEPPAADDLDALEGPALKALAMTMGIAFAPRTHAKTLRELIRQHRSVAPKAAVFVTADHSPSNPPPEFTEERAEAVSRAMGINVQTTGEPVADVQTAVSPEAVDKVINSLFGKQETGFVEGEVFSPGVVYESMGTAVASLQAVCDDLGVEITLTFRPRS